MSVSGELGPGLSSGVPRNQSHFPAEVEKRNLHVSKRPAQVQHALPRRIRTKTKRGIGQKRYEFFDDALLFPTIFLKENR